MKGFWAEQWPYIIFTSKRAGKHIVGGREIRWKALMWVPETDGYSAQDYEGNGWTEDMFPR